MHTLCTVPYTFPKVLMRICFIIQSFSSWWPFPLFSWPQCVIWRWCCKEKLDVNHPLGSRALWYWIWIFYFSVHNGSLIKFNFRVHLSKRRARGGAGGVQSAVSQLVVKHRELNENEKKAQVSEEPSKRAQPQPPASLPSYPCYFSLILP